MDQQFLQDVSNKKAGGCPALVVVIFFSGNTPVFGPLSEFDIGAQERQHPLAPSSHATGGILPVAG